jgi:hypothetical protein
MPEFEYLSNDELTRLVYTDPRSTPREVELAQRLEAMATEMELQAQRVVEMGLKLTELEPMLGE